GPEKRPVHELRRQPERVHAGHAERAADGRQRPDDRAERVDDGQRGQRVRAGPVRPDRHELCQHALRLPPAVLHLVRAAPGPLGGAFLQGRLSDEIGHFENCNGPTPVPATPFGLDANGNPVACPAGNTEGFGSGTPTDGDDSFCFPASEAMLIRVTGCTATNNGFDSLGYQPVWPDGNTALHPEPFLFSSPLTGPGDTVQYSRTAFEADIPRIEGGTCRFTGVGCTQLPTTDKGAPVTFYPFYSAFQDGVPGEQGSNGCMWGFGSNLPGATTNF